VAEPLLLVSAGDLAAFARTVLLVHAATAVALLALSAPRKAR
jgi:hypothetical protein